jgi:hypothetical protein
VDIPWYECFAEYFDVTDRLYIANSAILINGGIDKLAIKNVKKTDTGYIVTVKRFIIDYEFDSDSLNWSYIDGKELFTMILRIDGDYMDVYLEDMQHRLQTYILVNQQFLKAMQNLLFENRADITEVQWPRRADGSMDYPPPQLTQTAPEQPETAATDTPQAEDAAAVTPARETVAQQPGTVLPLIIVLIVAGIAVVAGVVFMIRRKR